MTKLTADHICGKSIELEYKINELFQWEDRTLMCVEGSMICENCYFDKLTGDDYCEHQDKCGENIFTNKLIFSAEGIKLQIKRKGAKIKVKVLELSEEFDNIENDEFTIYKSNIATSMDYYMLGIYEICDKIKHKFDTEQEAIDWVDGLFSLRGE